MRKIRIRTVYFTVLLAAILFRSGALFEFLHSPLAQYSHIPGLDMKTHLELGVLFGWGQGVFALYRLTTDLIRDVTGLVILQSIAGCLTALLTAFSAFRLFGKRTAALLAGLTAAWYGNAVLYELVTLPETLNVLTVSGAFAAVLQARRKHFALPWSMLAGVLLALCATGRPVNLVAVLAALVWMGLFLCRRKNGRAAAALAAGLLLVWGPVTLWNGLHGWPLPVYGSNFAYAAKIAGETHLTSWNVGETAEKISPLRIAAQFPGKFLKVFSIREIPDNINYYFLKERFLFMRFAVPVALLVTAALAGMLTGLIRRDRRAGLLLLWLCALSVIFAAYYPAGRYRLILYPFFALFAGYFLESLRHPDRALPGLAFVLVLALEWVFTPHPAVLRAADHTAWGMGQVLRNAQDDADKEFMEALRLSNGAPRETARVLHRLLLKNRPVEARRILREYPGKDPYRRFYDALLDYGDGSVLAARQKLEALQGSVPPEVTAQYFYFLGEACLRTGAGREAAAAYRELLTFARDPEKRRVIEEKIRAAEAMPQK
ncbi:MAG: hypothetical protein J6S73_04215 [Lentisphaeria bacterium]|nr:hypothetical protein [Lentisphaeria bacterium]